MRKLTCPNFFQLIPKKVWIIFVFALVLRIAGVWFGLPLNLNIDEPALVSSVLSLRQSLNPGHFEWPHLYFYFNAIFYVLFGILRSFLDLFLELGESWYSDSPFFLISRILSATLGALTIIPVYLLSSRMFNKKIGYIAIIILSVLPIHVFESHMAKTDVAQTLLTAISLLYIFEVYKNGRKKDFILSGIFIGLTTSIKYGGALLFLPLIFAFLLSVDYKKWIKKFPIKNFLLSGISSLIVFFLGTPFALLDFKHFFSDERAVGVLWQFKNVGSATFQEFPFYLFETFAVTYREGLGVLLWLLFLGLFTSFLFFNKRSKEYIFLLLPTLIFSIYISTFDRSPDHYFVFLIPFYVPALAKFIDETWTWLLPYIKNRSNIYIFTLLILTTSFIAVIKSDLLLARSDTRVMSYNWVKDNLKEEDFLYVAGEKLEVVTYKKNETLQIQKVDRSLVKNTPPYYVLIGFEGVTEESLITGNRDPESLSGNSGPILKYADLVFFADDTLRLGPPIYVFRVERVDLD